MEDEGFKQDAITKGLLKMYYSLRKDGKITGPDKILCAQLDFAASSFSSIKKGKRDAPQELIDAFTKKFKLTPESLLIAGKELAENSQKENDGVDVNKEDKNKIIDFLMEQIRAKDITIDQLRLQIQSLNSTIAYFTGHEGKGKQTKSTVPT